MDRAGKPVYFRPFSIPQPAVSSHQPAATFRLARGVAVTMIGVVLSASVILVSAQGRPVRPPADLGDQDRIAVVIGVAKYPDSSGLQPLKYSSRDAEAIRTELERHNYTVRMLTDEAAGAPAVRDTLRSLAGKFKRGEGTVLFYFAGHGLANPDDQKLYLATHDSTRASVFSSAITQDEVDRYLADSGAARRIMWLDACRDLAPAGGRSLMPRTAVDFKISAGSRVLYAAASDGISYEYDELRHGVFTYFLLKGLQGEAAAGEFISLNNLETYVTREVYEYGFAKGRSQQPFKDGEHSGDFLIGTHMPAAAVPNAGVTAPVATGGPTRAESGEAATRTAEVRQLHDEQRWGESLPILDRLLTADPTNSALLALRAHAYSHLGRHELAVAEGERAVRAGPSVAEAYLRRGEALMGQQKFSEALADFDRSLKLDAEEAETWGNRGATLAALGENQEALDSFTQGVQLRPDRHDLWVGRGAMYVQLGNHQRAIADFTEAINRRALDPVGYRARANAYLTTNQLELALKDANEAVKLNSDDPDSLATRAAVYMALGNQLKAVEDLRYVVRLRPEMPDAADALRTLEAQLDERNAPPVPPGPLGTPPVSTSAPTSYGRLIDEATAAIRAQRPAEAGELIQQMWRLDPARSEAWTLAGVLAMNSDNLAGAYEAYENALSRAGTVYFRLAHDHGMDQQPCFGLLSLNPSGVEFNGETGAHRFRWPFASIQEAAVNEFYGSAFGMFHLKAQMTDGSHTFNFAVVRPTDAQILNRRPDAEMLLGFINRRRQ